MSNLHESSPSESSELMRVPTGVELVRQVESGLGLVKEVLRESQAEYWFDQAREIFDSDITEIHYRSFEVIRDGEVFDDWTELSGECLKYILTKEALDKCLKLNENHIRALLFRAEWFIYFSQNEEALSI